MSEDQLDDDQEFKPEGAFLYSFDEAIQRTAECLRNVGADEETIWNAFQTALETLRETVEDVTRVTNRANQHLPSLTDFRSTMQSPVQSPVPSVARSAHSRHRADRTPASA
jgi:hypothetical protein